MQSITNFGQVGNETQLPTARPKFWEVDEIKTDVTVLKSIERCFDGKQVGPDWQTEVGQLTQDETVGWQFLLRIVRCPARDQSHGFIEIANRTAYNR